MSPDAGRWLLVTLPIAFYFIRQIFDWVRVRDPTFVRLNFGKDFCLFLSGLTLASWISYQIQSNAFVTLQGQFPAALPTQLKQFAPIIKPYIPGVAGVDVVLASVALLVLSLLGLQIETTHFAGNKRIEVPGIGEQSISRIYKDASLRLAPSFIAYVIAGWVVSVAFATYYATILVPAAP